MGMTFGSAWSCMAPHRGRHHWTPCEIRQDLEQRVWADVNGMVNRMTIDSAVHGDNLGCSIKGSASQPSST